MAGDDEQWETGARSGLYASVTAADAAEARRERRRRWMAVGIVAGAAVVAGGGVLVTRRVSESGGGGLPEPAAIAPRTFATTAGETGGEASVARTPEGFKPAQPVERSPAPAPQPSDQPDAGGDVRQEAAEDGVSERTETLENGTIRIVTAPRDLTGERELLLAGDEGEQVADGVRCTSDVRMGMGVPASRRPTLLLCWRTSAARSVVTVAIVPNGEPPTASSVAVIGREWERLE
ncbi:hypothetical protein AB0M02_18810 [Actinoplanes sp. NPDC051861]|uniref:hypothetical protein n=1 Tax=Actinoplanes sp. NPDC051861 TaxID=3155170 RepID=UPI00342F8916